VSLYVDFPTFHREVFRKFSYKQGNEETTLTSTP